MRIFKALQSIANDAKNAVVAIGNFDGVHKGHQSLLRKAKEIARGEKKSLAVLTFEPHPRKLFRPDEPPGRLTPESVKAWRLQEEGVDILYSLPFDWDFASQSSDEFINNVLQKGISAAHIVVGHDFRFGQMRKGQPSDIQGAGIKITVIDEISDQSGAAYSSSRVRQELGQGRIKEANAILGWDWEIRGEVVRGDRRGHDLGYPTANTGLGETMHPAYGVYAAKVAIEGEDQWHNAAINIGIKPMFEVAQAEVESHIFDFNREIYGKTLRVRPIQRLRSEAKFASVEDLKKQMAEDCRQAKGILK